MIVVFEYHDSDSWTLFTALNDPDAGEFEKAFNDAADMSVCNYELFKAAVTLFKDGVKIDADIFYDTNEAIEWWEKL